MITEFVVSPGERAKRLDAFLVSHERRVSRSSLRRLIVAGRIRLNTHVVKPGQKIKSGDRITMDRPEPGPLMANNAIIPLELLYEDDLFVVVNKPAGVVVHPTSGNWTGTLLNALLAHFQATTIGSSPNSSKVSPGLVHRLDKETSGVMVVAKTNESHRALCSQFETHTITRTYEAFVYGRPIKDYGMITVPIGRGKHDGKKVSTDTLKPQAAETKYEVLEEFGKAASRIKLTPLTGRQHQLRVHMTVLGCPILGDWLYGGQQVCRIQELIVPRVMLHAMQLGFEYPMTKGFKEFTAPFPSDMQAIRQILQ